MAQRPNLLFIFTDEQRADTLACYGNTTIQAPNLNRLAAQSFVVERAYCTQPVCTPSRSSIMTGYYPHTTGCIENNDPLRPEHLTLAERAPDDYTCTYYGKWHLGSELVPQRGFSEFAGIEDGYRAHYADATEAASRLSDYHHFLLANGFEPDGGKAAHGRSAADSGALRTFSRQTAAEMPEPFTKASFLGARSAAFIEAHAHTPWIHYVNFLEPHMPFDGPLNDLHDPANLETGPAFLRPPDADASLVHRTLAAYYGSTDWRGYDLRGEAGWRTLRRNYWGLVTLVDRAVGRILAAVEASGQADRTIVVFTSDHGDMMGDHNILAKCTLYEEAMRVPLLLRVPWLSDSGRRIDGAMSLVDLVPTLLDLMGVDAPADVQGVSRADVLRGAADLADNDVIVEWNGSHNSCVWPPDAPPEAQRIEADPWRSILSRDGWKLNASASDQSELFDLTADPHELTNRFDDPAQRGRVRGLLGRIRAWQTQTGDAAPLPVV